MRSTTALRSIVGALLLAAMTAAPGEAQVKEAKNHPLIEPYAGSVLSRRDDVGHADYKLVIAIDPAGKSDDQVLKSTIASGNLTRLVYESPKERSPLEVFTNYEEALKGAGFEILFECKDKECGPSYASSRWARVNGMRIVSSPMWYLAAKKSSIDMEAYVAVSVVKGGHQIDVLEAKEMEKGKVKISIEALRKELVADGKAVLEGIYFDTDKAVLKPESKPALAVIAELLQADPAMKVYIVGHTDTDGELQHNLTLSRARAQAVVDALTKENGVALHRLEAHGVGPLSPAKSNRGADGKAVNRRVEMVER